MAKVKFNAPNINDCSLVVYYGDGGTSSVSDRIFFPWYYDPTLADPPRGPRELNAEYIFTCGSCTFSVLVNQFDTTTTTTSTTTEEITTSTTVDICSTRGIGYYVGGLPPVEGCDDRGITFYQKDFEPSPPPTDCDDRGISLN